jgi:CheY-like chemotaxis protein
MGGPAVPHPAEPSAHGRSLRILLAEDNQVNQQVAQLMLTKLGHRVDAVGNGSEAVQAARLAEYDVVLMDVHMPEVDGLTATRRIRAELPAARQPYIIAMTASVLLEDRAACVDAGMEGYLAKPVRVTELAAALALVPASSDTSASQAELETAIRARLGELTGPEPTEDELTLVDQLIDTFLTRVPVTVEQLADALRDGDGEIIAARAHALKGSAANIGADSLADLADGFEAHARAGRVPDAAPSTTILRDEVDLVLQVLGVLRAEHGASLPRQRKSQPEKARLRRPES